MIANNGQTSTPDLAIAESIQAQLAFKCLQNKASLDVPNTTNLLSSLARSQLNIKFLSQSELSELEAHILVNVSSYLDGSMDLVLTSLLQLKYKPLRLLQEVDKMNQFAMFRPHICVELANLLLKSNIQG